MSITADMLVKIMASKFRLPKSEELMSDFIDYKTRESIAKGYKSGDLLNFYDVDFYSLFTPIEYACWTDIHSFNLPFKPQYPVDRYFVDFADPKKKIVIECDGKHHTREKDRPREDVITGLGWTIYRIPGWKCLTVIELQDINDSYRYGDIDEYEMNVAVEDYFDKTSEAVVRSIAWRHYGKMRGSKFEHQMRRVLFQHNAFNLN